jgi:hypothetical protein
LGTAFGADSVAVENVTFVNQLFTGYGPSLVPFEPYVVVPVAGQRSAALAAAAAAAAANAAVAAASAKQIVCMCFYGILPAVTSTK